ncbi:MAG: hypothetical protein ACRDP3_14040 [Streptomyces sp.]|uniref:hypothetical protein n=1 Tax=Streptomyces sp. TaxID=1931 RepID=UPI003D6C4E05
MLACDELTSTERELWGAFPEGRHVDLRTGVPEDDARSWKTLPKMPNGAIDTTKISP